MTKLELINQIDQQLANSVDATRAAHLQIQQIMDGFKRKVKVEESKGKEGKSK